MMRNKLTLLLLAGLLGACSAQTDYQNESRLFADQRAYISQQSAEDRSKDLSGAWLWEMRKDSKILRTGWFYLNEKDGKLAEGSHAKFYLTGLEAKSGGKSPDMIVLHSPLSGKHTGDQLEFVLKTRDGSVSTNKATVRKQGWLLDGQTEQTVATGNGKPMNVEYEWIAIRMQDLSPPETPQKES